MKRKTVLFILIAALLAFAVHAADTVNIRLDELGMSPAAGRGAPIPQLKKEEENGY